MFWLSSGCLHQHMSMFNDDTTLTRVITFNYFHFLIIIGADMLVLMSLLCSMFVYVFSLLVLLCW